MKHFMRWCLALCCMALLQGCAVGSRLIAHQFEFNGRSDGWAETADLLEYSYGDQYRMVIDSVAKPRGLVYRNGRSLPPQSGVNGPMPVGEFLYVKWRIRATGQILEERVDLRHRLPRDMTEHSLTFVIDCTQLYVYVMTPKSKAVYGAPPLEKTWLSKSNVTYEIFPQLKKP